MAISGTSEGQRHDARGGTVNPASRALPSALYENFLGADDAARLLRFALEHEERFIPSMLQRSTGHEVDATVRRSFDYDGPSLEWSGALDAALRARLPELAAAVGVPMFKLDKIEFTLSAYRDGCFYKRHMDLATGAARETYRRDRLLTAVYYVHRVPKAFQGGVLELLPISGEGPVTAIEPRHDRLAVFPAFAPHLVTETSVPGDRFENARFAVNCWMCREKH